MRSQGRRWSPVRLVSYFVELVLLVQLFVETAGCEDFFACRLFVPLAGIPAAGTGAGREVVGELARAVTPRVELLSLDLLAFLVGTSSRTHKSPKWRIRDSNPSLQAYEARLSTHAHPLYVS